MQTTSQALQELATGEVDALVTIETVERLTVRAVTMLDAIDLDGDGTDADPSEQIAKVRDLLTAVINHTISRTATRVKDQAVSDAIAARAADNVRRVTQRL